MKKLYTLILTLALIPVAFASEYDDTQIARELKTIELDNYQAQQQSLLLQQQQQNIHAIEREQDYQRSLQQRQDKTDYRYLGKY